ncbi:MAG: ATP-binding protein [Candidatus Nanohaloarchaea archaeon]
MTGFLNREEELEMLKDRYNSGERELIVVYGRRRVGKSELVRESLKDTENAVYYQATESTPSIQLENFAEIADKSFPEIKKLEKKWETLLQHLGEKDAVVVIDEFPFLIDSDSSIVSKFQRVWDEHLKETGMTLILIGSSISVMEEKVMSGGSPLYGRRTGSIDLKPLDVDEMMKFYPINAEDAVKAYSVFGGTPYYLESLEKQKTVAENIRELIMDSGGKLHDEPEFLLKTELGKPGRYFSILKSIASGYTTQNEIAQATGIDSSQIGSYLSKLRKIRLVKREVPVTEDPKKTRRSIYRLSEPLFRFWFRFIYGRQDEIELSERPFETKVKPQLNDYVSESFEDICRKKLPETVEADYYRIGSWWYQENEIDIVGLAEAETVLGECKYRERKTGIETLEKLEEKKEAIRIPQRSTENIQYVIFSKSGFNQNLEKAGAEREDLTLLSIKDFIGPDREK